jgi:hypothetical protein
MALKEALIALNKLKDDGVIGDYAICGSYAYSFYTPGLPTYDLDVLSILPSDNDFHRLYEYFRSKNARIEDVYIYIDDMPVQFLPNNISPLHHEAIIKARVVQFEGVTSKFVSIEYLIVLLLTAFRSKDKIRVQILLNIADKDLLLEIIRRFDNGQQLYKRYKEVLASTRKI